MKEVTGAGGIIIRGREVLLVRHTGANDDKKLGFAKGHVDSGETLEETALREVFEETRRRSRILRYLGSVVRGSVEYDEAKRPIGPSRKTIHLYLMADTEEIDQMYEGHTTPVWCRIGTVVAGDDPDMQMRHSEERAFLETHVLPLIDAQSGE